MAVYEEYLNYRLTGRCSNPFWQRKFGGVSGGGGGTGGDGGEPAELLSWEGVAYHIDKGDYKDVYAIGDMVPLDLGSEGLINMQIAAFDVDTLADGSGTAAISWVAKELLATPHRMNPALISGVEGTGALGGWEKCEMRTYLESDIKQLIPEQVLGLIQTVIKYSTAVGVDGVKYEQTTNDAVWLPSRREVFGYTWNQTESKGAQYKTLFANNSSRRKAPISGSTYTNGWWLRSAASSTAQFIAVSLGDIYNDEAETCNSTFGHIALGFCTGKTPT